MTIMTNALSGALASQMALSATSQNIANLQTKGYTRQAALLSAVGADASGKAVGNGVQVSSLLRFSDGYKSQQMWRAAAETGQYSQTQPYLTQLERVMGDDTASLSVAVDQFFSSLNAVAGDNATSTPLRQQVLTAAGLLAQRFNSLNNVYNAQQQSVSQQRSAIVDSANANISKIAALNARITQANAVGAPASSLIDARDLAIDELSGQMALEVSEQPGGLRDISLKTGQALVIGNVGAKLEAVGGVGAQSFNLKFASTTYRPGRRQTRRPARRPLRLRTGHAASRCRKAWPTSRNSSRIKSMPSSAPAMRWTARPASRCSPIRSGATSMINVVAGLEPTDLAFSSDGTPGDSGNLLKLVGINSQTVTVTGLGTVLLSDADTQLVGKLGVLSQQNQAALATANTMRTHAVDDWQSTSGVNQDEEAVNLVEYQNMYQANMKVMSVANSLFDATLAMMG